ncbi:hypothetical protein, partial [Kribbella sp.]|uniref:hypothetical protein n=1 Tax=Kribbella sp. TaxID=1871183 RepID=UPI002D71C07D
MDDNAVDTGRDDGRAGGDGPAVEGPWSQKDYHHPAAGWGAAMSVARVLGREHTVASGTRAMFTMNHEHGGF